jgi:hypothetical protein
MATKRKSPEEDILEDAEQLGELGGQLLDNSHSDTPVDTQSNTQSSPKELSPILKALSKPKAPIVADVANTVEETQRDDTLVALEVKDTPLRPRYGHSQTKRTPPRNTPRFSTYK